MAQKCDGRLGRRPPRLTPHLKVTNPVGGQALAELLRALARQARQLAEQHPGRLAGPIADELERLAEAVARRCRAGADRVWA